MKKPNLGKFLKTVRTTVVKHSPEILTGVGIAGMVATTVLAVKATPKALDKIRDYEDTVLCDHEKIKPVDAIKLCWKDYIPAAVTGIASITCLVGATSVSARRTAALAAAYQISETALSEYRDAVIETVDEKQKQIIEEKVADEQLKKTPVSKSDNVPIHNGDIRCFDPMSGRYFSSSRAKIKTASADLNNRMINDITGYASLNDFYDEIDIPRTDVGDMIGWNTTNRISVDIRGRMDDDDQLTGVLEFYNRPEYGYDK